MIKKSKRAADKENEKLNFDFINLDSNLQEFNKKRIYVADIGEKDEGKDVLIAGWIHEQRDLGKIRFLLLKDISGIIQIIAHKDETDKAVFDLMTLPRESVIIVSGKVKKSRQAPNGREIIPKKIQLIARAKHPLPVDTSDFSKTELPKRLDYRFLDFHRKKIQAIFKVQSKVAESFIEHFLKKGFIHMQPPCIISSASEGGTELFPVKYFEKNAYLAQSPQLYKQMLACSMEKVTMITPVWRAEKHNTSRHLNEIRQMDIEVGFADDFVVMKQMEDVVKYIVKKVMSDCKAELEILKVKLEVPKASYISYEDTIKLLNKDGVELNYGDDIPPEGEKKLDELFPDTIVFVHTWPLDLKPFYIMPKSLNKDEKLSKGFDAIYKGIEISSGGQRIHLPELIKKRLKAKGLNPKYFTHYIDSFRYGSVPHGGWSIGLERFTTALLGLGNIREACMFPRDRDRLVP